MEWTEEALILGTKKHGETSVILEVMTKAHGRHLGLVRSGRSKAMQPVLQAGNQIRVTWRARLEEHLGAFQVEPINLRTSYLMDNEIALHGLQTLCHHLRLLPEREQHIGLFQGAEIILENLGSPHFLIALLVRFEIALLEDLGFGLDLAKCAATGLNDDLIYVSPKTGRAVSRISGEPYKDRLLLLPLFLRQKVKNFSISEMKTAFALPAYFFNRHIYGARGLKPPLSRDMLVRCLERDLTE